MQDLARPPFILPCASACNSVGRFIPPIPSPPTRSTVRRVIRLRKYSSQQGGRAGIGFFLATVQLPRRASVQCPNVSPVGVQVNCKIPDALLEREGRNAVRPNLPGNRS